MALIYLYKDLQESETFTSNQLKVTSKATGIQFTEHLNSVGEFEFTIPTDDSFCEYVQVDYLVSIDGYFGIIRQLKQVEQSNQSYVVISGEDLKGYLTQRKTLYPTTAITEGLQGYDAIKDVSTETVIKHFINNNIINPTNPCRKIVGFTLAPDNRRGLISDQYMSRFESLNDVCTKNLEGQQMGYKVSVDIKHSQFVFDVVQGVNRTANQYENNRIIFDVKYKNLNSWEYFLSRKNYKNTFYSSLSKSRNEAKSMTCMYYRDGEQEAQGSKRFEQHLNVSVNLPEVEIYANMKQYALKEASNYEMVETITATTLEKQKYGVDYLLGDFVTVQAHKGLFKKQLVKLDVQITSVTHIWTNSGVKHELGFGTGKISKFDLLERKIKNGGF